MNRRSMLVSAIVALLAVGATSPPTAEATSAPKLTKANSMVYQVDQVTDVLPTTAAPAAQSQIMSHSEHQAVLGEVTAPTPAIKTDRVSDTRAEAHASTAPIMFYTNYMHEFGEQGGGVNEYHLRR